MVLDDRSDFCDRIECECSVQGRCQKIKVDQGVSYPAARRIVEQNRGGNSFANIVGPPSNSALQQTNERVDQLTVALAAKDNEIAKLRAALATRPSPPETTNDEIAALKAIVADQAKQIQLLTEQLSAFLKAVMPAASICHPQTIKPLSPITVQTAVPSTDAAPASAVAMTPAPADTIVAAPAKDTSATPAAVTTIKTTNDFHSEGFLSDSDTPPSELSQNVEFFSPRPEKSAGSPRTPNRPGTPIPGPSKASSDPSKIPNKRPRGKISRTETLFQQQQQKKSKLKGSTNIVEAVTKLR
nr:uncharacterized protein LOC115258853 [Aedes albopictus]